ncbi:hypothetical protein JCM10213_004471 [Rhodosporidiobolus nylandii]
MDQRDSSTAAPPSSSSVLPTQVYTDCQTCRITGTVTFAAVGVYAMTVSRATAKTQVGKGVASLFGLGFLVLAAGRWTAYTPPSADPPAAGRNEQFGRPPQQQTNSTGTIGGAGSAQSAARAGYPLQQQQQQPPQQQQQQQPPQQQQQAQQQYGYAAPGAGFHQQGQYGGASTKDLEASSRSFY